MTPLPPSPTDSPTPVPAGGKSSTPPPAGAALPVPPLPGAGVQPVVLPPTSQVVVTVPFVEPVQNPGPTPATVTNGPESTTGAQPDPEQPQVVMVNAQGQTIEEVRAVMEEEFRRKRAEAEAAAEAKLRDPQQITVAGLPFYDMAVLNSLLDRQGAAPLLEMMVAVLEAKSAAARAMYEAQSDHAWLRAHAHYQSCADYLRAAAATVLTFPALAE